MDYIFFFFLVPRNPSCYSFSSVKVACAVVTWLAVVAWVCNQVSQHSLTQYFKEVIQAELLKEARVILFGGCRSDQLKKKQQIKIHTRSFSSNLAPPAKNCNKFSYVVTFFTLIEVKLSFLLNHWKLQNAIALTTLTLKIICRIEVLKSPTKNCHWFDFLEQLIKNWTFMIVYNA